MENLNFPLTWACLILECPIYYLLYMYLDQVIPDTYGISKSCCFCLRKNRRRHRADVYSPIQEEDISKSLVEDRQGENIRYPMNSNAPIQIRSLTKKYGAFKAVDDLNLDIYSNQVFALLGHNGAGKTTAIYMMTGILKPSSGTAQIYGHDLLTDLEGVR